MKNMHFFRILNMNFEKMPFINIFIISFLKSFFFFFLLSWEKSSIHSKLFTGSFCDIAHPYKLFTSQYLALLNRVNYLHPNKYDDSIFLLWYLIYLLLAFAYQWIEWHIPLLISFSTINSISSVNNSNFTLFFFKAALPC